ncbi:hypothetical protein ACIGO8_23400 [Streptomyces sp. NPDC053493]|uniref:hypothetical protein n=1 Tax=Streptomyces sp. NPDC053493 TaxID=3365705 RepID=UPI0037D1A432
MLIGWDVYRYIVAFCSAWALFLGVLFGLQGGPVEDYAATFQGFLGLTGAPSLVLIVVARLLVNRRAPDAFPAVCGALLLLPALLPLLVGAPEVFLVQLFIGGAFLAWDKWSRRSARTR